MDEKTIGEAKLKEFIERMGYSCEEETFKKVLNI